jgi:hypothetical protein
MLPYKQCALEAYSELDCEMRLLDKSVRWKAVVYAREETSGGVQPGSTAPTEGIDSVYQDLTCTHFGHMEDVLSRILSTWTANQDDEQVNLG